MRFFRAWGLLFICAVAMVTLSFSMVNEDIARTPHFDIFDEGAHYDYVLKLSNGEIPAWGSSYEQETLYILDCLGSTFSEPGDCSSKNRDAKLFPPSGFNYEAQQPPLGYLPYLAFLDESSSATALENLNTIRRNSAIFWLGLTMTLVCCIIVASSMSYVTGLLFALLIFLNPTFIHAVATVNNDAAVVPAVLFWFLAEVLLRAEGVPKGLKFAVRVSVGLVLGLVKGFLVLLPGSVLLVGLVFVLRNQRGRSWLARLRLAAVGQSYVVLASSMAAYLLFLVYQASRGLVKSEVVLEALLGFSKTEFLNPVTYAQSVANVLATFRGSYAGEAVDFTISDLTTATFLILATVSATIEARRLPVQYAHVGNFTVSQAPVLVGATVLVLVSLAWPTVVYLQGHFDFAASPRYALMGLPIIAAGVGHLRKRVPIIPKQKATT